MLTFNTSLRSALLLTSLGLLSACQSDQQTSVTDMSFSTPSRLLQTRAIDVENLEPIVKLSNGDEIEMQRNDDNSWTGSLDVQPNNTYFVFVTWVETLPQGDLILAEWSRNVEVDNTGGQVTLGTDDYDYSADHDNDSIANIDEREGNTDPFVSNNQQIGDDNNTPVDDDTNTSTDTNSDASDANNDVTDTNGNEDSETTDETSDESVVVVTMPDEPSDNVDTESDSDDNNNEDVVTDNDDIENESEIKQDEATVIIPRIATANAPIIDGEGVRANPQDKLLGEWASAVQVDIDGNPLLIDNLMIDNNADSADGSPYRSWAAMHDGVNLYLLVLSDDVGARHGDSANVWEDDALELFIDADNSKLPMWGDADDFHYMIPLLKLDRLNANRTSDGRIQPGPMTSDVELTIDFHAGLGIGPDGIRFPQFEQDVYELAIPLAEAGIQIGQAFGLELQIDDDDDGGSRDAKWGWFHPSRVDNVNTDTTYKNPSVMGTVVLQE